MSLTPWISLLLLGTVVIHTLMDYGLHPELNPLTELPAGLRFHCGIFGLGWLATWVTFPAWVLTLGFRRIRLKWYEHIAQLAVYLLGFAAVNFSPMYEPTGIAGYMFFI